MFTSRGGGAWGSWASRAGPGGGGAWGLSVAHKIADSMQNMDVLLVTEMKQDHRKQAGGGGGLGLLLSRTDGKGGGRLAVWPLGGLEVNIGGQLQNDLTLKDGSPAIKMPENYFRLCRKGYLCDSQIFTWRPHRRPVLLLLVKRSTGRGSFASGILAWI
jgi:hypothetical protein